MFWVPSVFSNANGQSLVLKVLLLLFNVGLLVIVGIYGNTQSLQFVFSKPVVLDPSLIPFYNGLNANILSETYIFGFYWWVVFFPDLFKWAFFGFMALLAINGIRRPASFAISIVLCLIGLMHSIGCIMWTAMEYFDCKNAAFCRVWTFPFPSDQRNPVFTYWFITLILHFVLAVSMTLQLAALKYEANKQVRLEFLENHISVGGKKHDSDDPEIDQHVENYGEERVIRDRQNLKGSKITGSATTLEGYQKIFGVSSSSSTPSSASVHSTRNRNKSTTRSVKKFTIHKKYPDSHIDNLLYFGYPPPSPPPQ